MPFDHQYVAFGKISIHVHCLIKIFFFECWVVWVLCILNINPLLDISFANIFSHSVGCLFILLIMSFTVQKLFSLISSHLFLLLLPLPNETVPKKMLLRPVSQSMLRVFSSGSFFCFRSYILNLESIFEFIFVYGVRKLFGLILLHVAI